MIEMDDRQIEQILRESCSPQMPDGMRERVLSKSFNELPHRPSSRWSLIASRWKPILISASVLFILVADMSDMLVQEQLTKDIGKTPANMTITADSILSWQKELRDASEFSSIYPYCEQMKGRDQL